MEYPYNDDIMTFDADRGKYVLTENAMTLAGVDLRARLSASKTPNPEILIQNMLYMASDYVYDYIHEYSMDNDTQDTIIAKTPSMRKIIQRAMQEELKYLLSVGDPTLSLDKDKQTMVISRRVMHILDTTIPEYGVPITYCGRWC